MDLNWKGFTDHGPLHWALVVGGLVLACFLAFWILSKAAVVVMCAFLFAIIGIFVAYIDGLTINKFMDKRVRYAVAGVITAAWFLLMHHSLENFLLGGIGFFVLVLTIPLGMALFIHKDTLVQRAQGVYAGDIEPLAAARELGGAVRTNVQGSVEQMKADAARFGNPPPAAG